MEKKEISSEFNTGAELANEIYAVKELVSIIVDYYCFKNNIIETEEVEGEEWKIGTKHEVDVPELIPEKIHKLIEKSFETQLGRFIKK